jgi:hypothetical protein
MFERFRSLFRARAHRRDSDPITSLPERSHFHRKAVPITSPALPLLRSWSIRSAIWTERSPPASSMCHSVESAARVPPQFKGARHNLANHPAVTTPTGLEATISKPWVSRC